MRILMVVAYFIPEIGSAAHIYYDLAKSFVKRGHEVHVITSYPRKFNLDEKDRGKEFPLEDEIDGIKVHRCKHSAVRDIVFLRGLEHFLLPRIYFKKYKKMGKKFDVSLIYIPPLPLYYFARKLKKNDGTPSVLNFQDFHPQELTDVGVLKNKIIIKILQHIERIAYTKSDYITVLTHGGIKYIAERGGNKDRIKHIYNAVNIEDIQDYLNKRDFKKKAGIENKFLVSYAGILSPFQGVDTILDAAKRLMEEDDIIFYIVGDGMIREHLEKRIKNEKISNARLLPFQPREEYFNIISSSDISIVSLDSRMKAPCLPGKLINLMAASQPIVAMVPKDSETAYVVEKAGCGIVVEPDDIEEITEAILKLKNDPELRKKMGENGRKFLEENMNLEKNVKIYEEIFEKLVREKDEK